MSANSEARAFAKRVGLDDLIDGIVRHVVGVSPLVDAMRRQVDDATWRAVAEWRSRRTDNISAEHEQTRSKDPTDPMNRPHPAGRQWHPQAGPFAHLLALVISKEGDESNMWRDDVVFYIKRFERWSKAKGRGVEAIVNGLRYVADQLEGS